MNDTSLTLSDSWSQNWSVWWRVFLFVCRSTWAERLQPVSIIQWWNQSHEHSFKEMTSDLHSSEDKGQRSHVKLLENSTCSYSTVMCYPLDDLITQNPEKSHNITIYWHLCKHDIQIFLLIQTSVCFKAASKQSVSTATWNTKQWQCHFGVLPAAFNLIVLLLLTVKTISGAVAFALCSHWPHFDCWCPSKLTASQVHIKCCSKS